jgi:hypothetical protein
VKFEHSQALLKPWIFAVFFILFWSLPIFAQPINDSTFVRMATQRSKRSGGFQKVCPFESDAIAHRVLKEYGSIFVAADSVKVPVTCVFEDEEHVAAFQGDLEKTTSRLNGAEIILQSDAMSALLAAIQEANEGRLRITPLDGSIAGTRSYADTVRLWNSRFYRALNYWEKKGRISKANTDEARSLSPFAQVPKVVEWEARGLYFSTNFSRSIFTSVAPPGTSQHLSGLAFDVVEFGSRRVRTILNKHGWFQTVAGDEPHFTYLGFPETELPKRGLISVMKSGYKFWVPALQ